MPPHDLEGLLRGGLDLGDQVIRAELALLRKLHDAGAPRARQVKADVRSDREAGEARLRTEMPSAEQLQRTARERIGAMRLRAVQPERFFSVATRAARKAAAAAAKGQWDRAVEWKQKELVNFALYREALGARQLVTDARERWDDMFTPDGPLAKRRNMDLVNAARMIAASYFWPERRLGNASAALELVRHYDQDTFELLQEKIAEAQAFGTTVSEIPVDAFRAIVDAVDALWTQSLREQQSLVNGQLVERHELVDALVARLDALGAPPTQFARQDTEGSRAVLGLRAYLRRVESWADYLDGGNPHGVFRRFIWEPVSDAVTRYRHERVAVLQRYLELVKGIEGTLTRHPIVARELGYTFADKGALLHALLHTGNDSNLFKLIHGYAWGTIQQDGSIDTSRWFAFRDRMFAEGVLTQADMDFVQVADAAKESPETAAKVNDLATQIGVDPQFVRENLEDVEHRVRITGFDAEKFRQTSPALHDWLQRHPQQTPVVRDDLEPLGFLETVSRKAGNLYWSLKAGDTGMVEGFLGALQGGLEIADQSQAGQALRRYQGLTHDARRDFIETLDTVRARMKQKADAERAQRTGMGFVERGINSALESIVQQGPGIALGIVTGAEAIPLGIMGAQTFGQSYGSTRDGEGKSAPKSVAFAALRGGIDGAVEVATELLPVSWLLKDLKAGAPFWRTLLHQAMTEVPGEEIATALQDLTAWAAQYPDQPFSAYLSARPSAAADTLAATVAQSVLMVGGGKVLSRFAGAQDDNPIKELTDAAAQAKTQQRAPAALQAFVEHLAERQDAPPELHVDAQRFGEYFQEAGINPEQAITALGGDVEAYRLAVASQGDVAIQTSRYLATVPGSGHEAFFVDELRLHPEAKNARELKEDVEDAVAGAEADAEPVDPAAARIAADVTERLLATGRVTRPEAAQQGDLYAHMFTALAAPTKADAWQLFERYTAGGIVAEGRIGDRAPRRPVEMPLLEGTDDTRTVIPASEAPRGETPVQRLQRRRLQTQAVIGAVVRDARRTDPAVDPEVIAREVEDRLAYLEERTAQRREAGTGPALLRAIAERGGINTNAVEGEFRELAEEGFDRRRRGPVVTRRGTRTQTFGRRQWNGVAGVFTDEGMTPDDMAASLARQDERFGHLDGPDALHAAISEAMRASQVADTFPGTAELEAVGIAPGTVWWARSEDEIDETPTDDGDVSFNVDEFQQRVEARLTQAEQRLRELDPSASFPAALRPPFPIITVREGTALWRAAGGFSAPRRREQIPLAQVVATQDWIFPDTAARYADEGARTVPVAVQVNGRYYLADGHHRASAAWAKGETTIEADVVDVDVATLPHGEPTEFQQKDAAAIPEALEDAVLLPNLMPLAQQGNFENQRALKKFLQQRLKAAMRTLGVRSLDPSEPRVRDYLRRVAVREAEAALVTNRNAVGWYDLKVRQALGVLALMHPEIATEQDAAFAFKYALAVTSNGLKVDKNFELGERAYAEWRRTGKMPTTIGEGNAKAQIDGALKRFNEQVAKTSLQEFRDFLTRRMTVRDVKALGYTVSGEAMDTEVNGAIILGPKIGNGFFMNLMGEFGNLTMDRWFVRTWRRWTGTLIEDTRALVTKNRDTLRDLLGRLSQRERLVWSGLLVTDLTKTAWSDAALDRVGRAIAKASTKPANREVMDRTARGTLLRRAGNILTVNLSGESEVPGSAGIRTLMRETIQHALSELSVRGYNLTTADLQALLWYPEKRLYEAATADAGEGAHAYADDEAPDYANAAAALARARGIDAGAIEQALAREADRARLASAGRAGARRRGLPRRPAAGRTADRAGVAFRQDDVVPGVAPFYSRLQRAVESATLEKATGAQWKATIKNSKAGISQVSRWDAWWDAWLPRAATRQGRTLDRLFTALAFVTLVGFLVLTIVSTYLL